MLIEPGSGYKAKNFSFPVDFASNKKTQLIGQRPMPLIIIIEEGRVEIKFQIINDLSNIFYIGSIKIINTKRSRCLALLPKLNT